MNIDWKLWLVLGGLSLGLLGQLTDLLVCHWLPQAGQRSFCGAIASDISTFGNAAKALGTLVDDSADGGAPLPGLALP